MCLFIIKKFTLPDVYRVHKITPEFLYDKTKPATVTYYIINATYRTAQNRCRPRVRDR